MIRRRAIPGISPSREDEIRSQACELLNQLWPMRERLGVHDPESLARIAPVVIAQQLYGFEVVHVEEIPPEDGESEIPGVIDRHPKKIIIAQKFPLPFRRFTLAHEVGHLVLHPGRVYHRDRPLSGEERFNSRRPTVEREADLFAAESLMPTKVLSRVFIQCFGRPILGSDADDNVCYYLSHAAGKRIAPRDFRSMSVLERAKIVAVASDFGHTPFRSLVDRFGVSKTAMAIQLQDLGLVTE